MKKIIAIIAITGFALQARAQTASSAGSQQMSLSLSDAIAITFVGSGSSSGAAVSLSFNTVNDYKNGVTSDVQQLQVQSNKKFMVTVNADAANFTYAGSTSPSPNMSVNKLKLKVTANNTGGTISSSFTGFHQLSNSAVNLLTNCSNGGNQTFSVEYKAVPGFSYPSGSYTTNIVYTATQL